MKINSIIKSLKALFLPCEENSYRALFLSSNFLFYLVVILFAARVIILPLYIYFPRNIFFAEVISSELYSLLNRERQSLGLAPLQENPKLQKAAILKAQDMVERDYFGHKSPDGVPAWYWIKNQGYDYKMAGENLAIGFLDSAEVHQAWNDSVLHKQNLLNPNFKDIGIAVLKGEFQGNETTVVVQLFGKQIEKPVLEEEIIPPTEASVPVEEIPAPEVKPPEAEVAGKEKEVAEEAPPVVSGPVESLQYSFLEFLIKRYDEVARKAVFFAGFLVLCVLTLNVFFIVRLPLPPRPKLLILREFAPMTLLVLVFLILVGFLDKSTILRLIPHSLTI